MHPRYARSQLAHVASRHPLRQLVQRASQASAQSEPGVRGRADEIETGADGAAADPTPSAEAAMFGGGANALVGMGAAAMCPGGSSGGVETERALTRDAANSTRSRDWPYV